MTMMPRISDALFWHRHLHEGRYPTIRISPAEDFANDPDCIHHRWSFSVAAFEREKRELRFLDTKEHIAKRQREAIGEEP